MIANSVGLRKGRTAFLTRPKGLGILPTILMNITIMELYVAYQALLARLEYLENDADGNQEEIVHVETFIAKIESLGIPLELKE